MMHSFRKALSIFLAVILSLGTLPVNALAVENESGVQAPTVSFTAAKLTAAGARLTFASDQDGTYYCLIDESEAAGPDAQEVKELRKAAAGASGMVTSGPAITVSVAAELDGGKEYTAYLVVENENGVLSALQSLPLTAQAMLSGASAAGTPDTSWYTANPGATEFEISNADQLAGLAQLTDTGGGPDFAGKTITLTDNIDLSAYQNGTGWTPIGIATFAGTFDGNGKTITGLKISEVMVTGIGYGLFGNIRGGTVKNLMLKDVSITVAIGQVGGIAGVIESGSIENCYVSGVISAPGGSAIGGIAGQLYGNAANCISTASVSGEKNIGGVAGLTKGQIQNCYATGAITASTASDCRAGGIAGYVNTDGSIRNCAALNSSVTGVMGSTGRVFGAKKDESIETLNNYAGSSMQVNGSAVSGGTAADKDGAPKTDAEWLVSATWTDSSGLNWDAGTWDITDGSLPSLKVFGTAPPISIITINTQPAAVTNVTAGSITGTLTVGAGVSPDGTLSYQWYSNTSDSNSGGTEISGETGSSFDIPTDLTDGTYYYCCEVRAAGAASVRSNVAVVNVSSVVDTTPPEAGNSGAISLESQFHPEKITLSWTKATDAVSGQSQLKYYIYRSGSDNISTPTECEDNGILLNSGGSADMDSYSPGWPDASGTYYFNVIVKDLSGNAAAYQTVVRNGIAFSEQPQAVTMAQGYISGSLSVLAASAPTETVSYQWYYRDSDVYGGPTELAGKTGTGFTIPTDLTVGTYYYFCKASIRNGSIWAYSDRVAVTVITTPVTPDISGPESMTLTEGYAAVSTGAYTVTGTSPITVTKTAGNEKITWNDTAWKLDIAAGLAAGTYSVTLQASHPSNQKDTLTFILTVDPMPVTSVTIKTSPLKTIYKAGDALDLTGLVVTLNKSDLTSEDVALADFGAKGIVASPANGDALTAGISSVTITYTAGSKSVDLTITVKNIQDPPGKPELLEETATSVTLQTISSAKYRKGSDGAWQDSPTFTGLTPNTAYTFYAVFPETETHAESLVSEALSVTTDKAALSGTVTISGTAQYGETLTAVTSGLTVTPADADKGALSYQWKRSGDDTVIGTESSYTLTVDDIGKAITVTVTAANCDGSVTSSAVTVEKADGPLISAVTGSYTGNGTIFTYTVDPIADAEYSKDGSVWQDSSVFTGFTTASPATAFYARIKETETHKAGPEGSTGPVAFTKLENTQIPSLDYAVSISSNNRTITITPVTGAEYKFGDDTWGEFNSKGGYTAAETVTIQIRYKETDTHNAGTAAMVSVTLPVLAASITVSGANGQSSITTRGGTLQMLAEVLPAEALRTVTWSVSGTGAGISASGLLTATGNGTVMVRATATDGTGVYGEMQITISGQSGGSGGSSSDGDSSFSGSTTIVTPEQEPNRPVSALTSVTATAGANSAARVSIPKKAVTAAIARAQAEAKKRGKTANGISMAFSVAMPQGATALTATLTQSSLNSLVSAGVTSLEINGAPISFGFDLKALKEIQKQSGGNISIRIAPATELSREAQTLIGNRPVYSITISAVKNGKTTNIISLGSGTATLAIPYTPDKNEAVGYLFGVYVNTSGQAIRIGGSAYDAIAGAILLPTGHFSVYGVGYSAPSAKFTDIGTHWGKKSIDYVVGRGLLSGTSETAFSPNTAMTRGMLVTALGRLAGVDTRPYTTSSFTDVKADSAFRPYIEWAYKKGIVQGIDNSQFAPDRAVTREEIAVIIANYAKATGYKLPVIREVLTYADADRVGSVYKTAVTTMQQAGIMMGGSGNKFNPKANATRAEVSAMLHRYIKLTIDPATAQGWALNDAGRYLCYKDGKALTGTQTIDGVKYYFETNGTLKTGWVKDDSGSWRFYDRNKMLVGWRDIGGSDVKKTYYFDTCGSMVSGKWLQIDGKWYYFYTDGSLAKSTRVDGYEVDENGVRKTK